jgi:ATP adenylyltransferase/5',5'''-P-1,P-4-tetraphosphate phosphorylase II
MLSVLTLRWLAAHARHRDRFLRLSNGPTGIFSIFLVECDELMQLVTQLGEMLGFILKVVSIVRDELGMFAIPFLETIERR